MHMAMLVALFAFLAVASAQTDGNPHGWDRKRRCDHIDYDPPCGICEGVGGVATGDANDQITLAGCEEVEQPKDPSSVKRPIWGAKFTAKDYSEVLIGPKIDPFCFQVFPSNSSAGKLCYRPDMGTQFYDMIDAHTLREELNVYTSLGNVTSTIIHHETNFWVINKFPWYAAGVHQCVCTKIREGAYVKQKNSTEMYPIMYNWTNNLNYVGRENIFVEYGVGMMTLDHWAYGPHHVWTFPSSGYIQRMWQPYNGLQVFAEGNSNATVDPSVYGDIPPALCKKGGATFRIKCTDDGYPNGGPSDEAHDPSKPLGDDLVLHGAPQPPLHTMPKDASRAMNPVPRAAYKGEDFEDMSAVLNKWLEAAEVQTKPCAEWNATQLQQLQGFLYLARHSELDNIYQSADDNRRLQKPMEELQEDWAKLNAAVKEEEAQAEEPAAHRVQRDGHCHEAVMWWTHHLTEDTKQLLAQSGVTIPLLSPESHTPRCTPEATEGQHEAVAAACKAYEKQVLCVDCHSKALPPGHDFLRQ